MIWENCEIEGYCLDMFIYLFILIFRVCFFYGGVVVGDIRV